MKKNIYTVSVTSDKARNGFRDIASLLSVTRGKKITQGDCVEMALDLLKNDLSEELSNVSISTREGL